MLKKVLARRILHDAHGGSNPESETTGPRSQIWSLELGLSSFGSFRNCDTICEAPGKRLDIFLNGGIIRVAPETAPEGYEVPSGVNYLSHALLSRFLETIMQRTMQQQPSADVRVVIVSSEGYLSAPKNGIGFDKVKTDCVDVASKSTLKC